MSFNACPIATARAPIDEVWRLLADPSRYALWWDARTVSITPDGPAHPGQRVIARTSALGREWPVHLTIQRVDARKRELDLITRLPLGITVHNHIVCTSIDLRRTRITFG